MEKSVDLLVEVLLSLRHEDKPENRRLLAELDSLAVMEFLRRRVRQNSVSVFFPLLRTLLLLLFQKK